jgi:hypothetical protein
MGNKSLNMAERNRLADELQSQVVAKRQSRSSVSKKEKIALSDLLGTKPPTEPVPDPFENMSVGSQLKIVAGFLGFLALVLFVIVHIMMSPGAEGKQAIEASKREPERIRLAELAAERAKNYIPTSLIQVEAEFAVKERLRDPSSGQFSDFKTWRLNDSDYHYAFTGYVRGKNAFGGYAKNMYSGRCWYHPESNSVAVESLNVY